MSASTAEPEQVGLPVKWLYPLIPPLLTNPGEALLFEVKIIKNKKLKNNILYHLGGNRGFAAQ
ncbi:hypothetical protein CMV52_03435 [Klebsiella pneumoniae]|nr:hypothetical protein CMV52_03435 [Klebsiella pneumoniae]RJK80855.1 hypothetical protein CMV56_07485 [Klebsiella pneumoniae]